ncbi:NmrA family NAD(P)-binding protein [Gluconacetobacter entanii]|nr:NmrA family NAD(P)-binding protein [Gluconacetobacter entanii]MCE2578365.1 NmrA family NAD(P)-binding protein [Komagataeibacter sp. FNDCR1]
MKSHDETKAKKMFAVLGASGHIGAAVAETLLKSGHAVTVIIRNPAKATMWAERGASVALLDIHDTRTLARTLEQADRAFLLNPPANPALNTDVEERKTVLSILMALNSTKLEKIVVQSTYDVRQGNHCGDLGVLHEFEQGAQCSGIPFCIIRGAYYMSNWLPALAQAKHSGKLISLLPAHLRVPMVAPQDVGELAAVLLSDPLNKVGIYSIEGPMPYSADDIAREASQYFMRDILVDEVPRSGWRDYYIENGFLEESASSYENMTEIFINHPNQFSVDAIRGKTSFSTYLQQKTTVLRNPSSMTERLP